LNRLLRKTPPCPGGHRKWRSHISAGLVFGEQVTGGIRTRVTAVNVRKRHFANVCACWWTLVWKMHHCTMFVALTGHCARRSILVKKSETSETSQPILALGRKNHTPRPGAPRAWNRPAASHRTNKVAHRSAFKLRHYLVRHFLDRRVSEEHTLPIPASPGFYWFSQPWTQRTQNAATFAKEYRSYCSGTLNDSWYESALAVCAVAKSFIRGQSKN